jgi:uncharacterized protein YndB with AHSA1/START domain
MNAKIVAPEKPAGKEIVITRVFNAPRASVFQAWTDPLYLAQWWGPRGFTNPRCELDVRAGGIMRIDMHAPDGTIYPMAGIYLEITEPEQIVFTSGALDDRGKQLFEFLHTVTFAEKGGKTTLTIRSRVVRTTAEAAKYIGGFEAGMTQSLEKLADHLPPAGAPLILERTYHAPVALVWRAITSKEDFAHWYFKVDDFEPVVGFEFQFSGGCDNGKYLHLCKITEVVPGNKLAYTWRYDGYEGNSLVTFELFAEGDRTRLKLTHTGLDTLPKTPAFARNRFNEGWTSLLGTRLKEFVEAKFAESK